MIFEERKDGMVIRIPHKEIMHDDVLGFIFTIMKGRGIYRDSHTDDWDEDGYYIGEDEDADLDADDSEEE